MTPCPRCDCSTVDHRWRTDMRRLTVIDEWKCLDPACGHRWDTGGSHPERSEAVAVPHRTDLGSEDPEADGRTR